MSEVLETKPSVSKFSSGSKNIRMEKTHLYFYRKHTPLKVMKNNGRVIGAQQLSLVMEHQIAVVLQYFFL